MEIIERVINIIRPSRRRQDGIITCPLKLIPVVSFWAKAKLIQARIQSDRNEDRRE